jgi:apolipoprotein N-acyltransferase
VVEKSRTKTRAVLEADVSLGEDITPGVRIGWWLELIVIVSTAGLALLGVLDRRRRTGTMDA